MSPQAAKDLRVVEISSRIAGDYCTKLLANHGADVIKIELLEGSPVRREGPFPADIPNPEAAGLFLYLNTGKKSVTLDYTNPTGIALLKRLLTKVDILVTTMHPRQAKEQGLTYPSLEQVNPRLVCVNISDFGSDGPYADYQSTSLIQYALSDWMYSMGDPDREPLQPGATFDEYITGLWACNAALLAQAYAAETGLGQDVEVSALECQCAIQAYDTVSFSYAGVYRLRNGAHYIGSPWAAVMPCRNGYVQYQNGFPDKWPEMFKMIGRPDLITDPRFKDPTSQAANVAELDQILGAWFMQHTRQEIWEAALRHRLIFSIVPNVAEILELPPHQERRWFQDIEHPVAGKLRYPGAPFHLQDTPWQAQGPAPMLGQHNIPVLCEELGLREQDLIKLRCQGIV